MSRDMGILYDPSAEKWEPVKDGDGRPIPRTAKNQEGWEIIRTFITQKATAMGHALDSCPVFNRYTKRVHWWNLNKRNLTSIKFVGPSPLIEGLASGEWRFATKKEADEAFKAEMEQRDKELQDRKMKRNPGEILAEIELKRHMQAEQEKAAKKKE